MARLSPPGDTPLLSTLAQPAFVGPVMTLSLGYWQSPG